MSLIQRNPRHIRVWIPKIKHKEKNVKLTVKEKQHFTYGGTNFE